MKTRSMVCADVAQSDKFLAMTLEAQLFYFLLLFHADVCGRIYGAARICRGYGFDSDTLLELYDNGYLLYVDGLTVDAHCWRNNRLDARLKPQMDSFDAYTSGIISFQGEPFKSSYQLNDVGTTDERRNNDVATTPNAMHHQQQPNATQRQQQPNCNDNPNSTERQSQSQEQTQFTVAQGESAYAQDQGTEGKELHPCQCPNCKSVEAHYWQDVEGTHIDCPECGTFSYDNRR